MRIIITLILGLLLAQISISQIGMHFDGIDDYVQTTYLGVTGNADRTFEAWIKIDSNAPATNLCILDYGTDAAGKRNTFMVTGTRKLTFLSGGTGGNLSSDSANIIPENQWTHVAFALGNDTGYLYVNGVLVGSDSLNTYTSVGGTSVRIGRRVPSGNLYFKGIIDEVRIWNVARTATELLANKDSEICTIHSNLKGYFKFNEGIANGTNTGIANVINYAASTNGVLNGFTLLDTFSNYVIGKNLTPGYSKTSFKDSACNFYTTSSGSIYTTTGVYTNTLTNSVSCDSIVEFDIIISSVNDSVALFGINLTSMEISADSYQWVDCNNNFSPIVGETTVNFTPNVTGSYAVVLVNGACIDTSDCNSVTINNSGINGNSNKNIIEVYPNPASSFLTIENLENSSILGLIIMDVSGKIVLEEPNYYNKNINIEGLDNGVYFLQVNTTLGISVKKFVKN